MSEHRRPDVDDVLGPPLLYSIPQAQFLTGGISRTEIYALMDSGRLRTVRIGRRRLIVRSSLDEFVAELETAT